MSEIFPAWLACQRERWLRHDWRNWVDADAERWMAPGTKHFLWANADQQQPEKYHDDIYDNVALVAELAAERELLLRLKGELAAIKAELKFRRFLRALKYSPDQPRKPAGNPDGGQWTSGGRDDSQTDQTRLEQSLASIGLPDLIQSHSGMYYFGPQLRSSGH
jgi:hypothetical protein